MNQLSSFILFNLIYIYIYIILYYILYPCISFVVVIFCSDTITRVLTRSPPLTTWDALVIPSPASHLPLPCQLSPPLVTIVAKPTQTNRHTNGPRVDDRLRQSHTGRVSSRPTAAVAVRSPLCCLWVCFFCLFFCLFDCLIV
jgi:hypothetical protein